MLAFTSHSHPITLSLTLTSQSTKRDMNAVVNALYTHCASTMEQQQQQQSQQERRATAPPLYRCAHAESSVH